jgi:hypothetical protein
MFTVVAWSSAPGALAAYQNVAAIVDQHIRYGGNFNYLGKLNQVIGKYACATATGTAARVISPSLRKTNPLHIAPVEMAIIPTDNPALDWHPESPVPLIEGEPISVEMANMAATIGTAGLFLSDGPIAKVNGDIRTVLATCLFTPIASTWVLGALAFADNLPLGNYRVVGARVVFATGVLFRFVPLGAIHRPGGICAQLASDADFKEQRKGGLGEWFTFDPNTPPGIEILCSSAPGAGTAQVFIDVIPA